MLYTRGALGRFGRALVGLGLLTFISMPVTALADSDEHHPDFVKHALWSLLYHQKDLNLSADQVNKIKQIKINYAKAHVKAEAEKKLTRIDVMVLKLDETSDIGALEAAMQKHERAETAMHLEGVKAIRAAMGVLNAEQRDKWKMQMMKFGKKVHERKQRCDRD